MGNQDAGLYPERIIPDDTDPGIVSIHLKRYEFAAPHAAGRRVLDIACGVGYGARYLADSADTVDGVDLDWAALSYARRRYADATNVRFTRADASCLPFGRGSFDVVCSFETIEHVPDVGAFLAEVARTLKSDGVFLVSTPCAEQSTTAPDNPYHVREWSASDFLALLRPWFSAIAVFGQTRRESKPARRLKQFDYFRLRARLPRPVVRVIARLAHTRAKPDLTLDDVLIVPDALEGASEIVAVCRGVVRVGRHPETAHED